MRVDVPARAVDAGTELHLLVLAAGERGCAAVDLGSGAMVRCQYPRRVTRLAGAYEVVVARRASEHPEPPAYAPETVELADAPELVGRLRGRRAEKYLRRLVHPPGQHLLGFPGPSTPFWTMRGDRPSLTLVELSGSPIVERHPDGTWCRFRTRRLNYLLPLHDPNLGAASDHPVAARLEGSTLTRALGWKPHRLLVVLTPPHEGHCYKVVAAMLPRP